jgi:hypothetical protein
MAHDGSQQDADEPAFFVRVDRIVPLAERAPYRRHREENVERHLRERRADAHAIQERRTHRSEHTKSGHRHVLPERISDEIDRVTERCQRANAVKLAERRPARLEERLGRNHQDAHAQRDFRTNP